MSDLDPNNPTAGLYLDVPFNSYREIRAVNAGLIKHGLVSMAQMKAAWDGEIESEDSRDRKFGRALHHRLLEPDSFEDHFHVAPGCEAELQSGARKGQRCGARATWKDGDDWYCGTHKTGCSSQPDDLIDEEERERIERIALRLHGHPLMRLLRRPGWSEVTAVWEMFGVLCKSRIDRYAPTDQSRGLVALCVDLKKCQLGSIWQHRMMMRSPIAKSIWEYKWHCQCAMYEMGIAELQGEAIDFWWLFVEDTPPFEMMPLPCDVQTMTAGRYEVERVLRAWRHACELDHWPGLSDELGDRPDFRRGGLPRWALSMYDGILSSVD